MPREQDELRFGLAERLESADKAYLDGEQRLSQGDRRGANKKFEQARVELGRFIERVQMSTQDAQHPANPISAATATTWTATAQQIQVVIASTDPVAAGREPTASELPRRRNTLKTATREPLRTRLCVAASRPESRRRPPRTWWG